MRKTVTIVDYGMGNLLSVARALEYCGSEVVIASDPETVGSARSLILPGVGAFSKGMSGLKERGLIEPIKKFSKTGRPFLGICLGMQMMLESSDEFGMHEGLGLIEGHVVAIPAIGENGLPNKIPHIGWNKILTPNPETKWEKTILDGLCPGVAGYFVHSFTAVPQYSKNRLADCDYYGRKIAAVIVSGMLFGCQFHPEKSGEAGLRIIKNFINLS